MYLARILFLSFIVAVGLTAGIHAQSAQQIVAKHFEALGGKEKLQSINSLYLEGVAVLGNGVKLPVKIWKVYDRLYRQEVVTPAGNVVVIVTPRQGWRSGPGTNGVFKPLTDEQYQALKPEIDPGGPLVDYNNKGVKLELAGKDTVGGRECFKIRAYFPPRQMVTYSIDEKTWYILQQTYKGEGLMGAGVGAGDSGGPAGGEVRIGFSDYKIGPGGYIFPYTISSNALQGKITIEKIEINHTVDADALSKPK